jgi:hypothetical protein
MLDKQEKENQAWYDRRYNEDYTQSAEAQAALTQAREQAKDMVRRAEGTQAIMGGTDESVNATREAAANAVADATTAIASQATARKDAVESQYLAKKDAISQQQQAVQNQQAQANAQMGSQALQAGLGLASADASSILGTGKGMFDNLFKKKQEGGTNG